MYLTLTQFIFSEVDKFSAWCKENYLDLNVGKTKKMVLDFRKKTLHPPPPVPDLIIDDVAVESVDEYRYMGTVLDNNLTFHSNVDSIHKKCQSRIYCLQKLRNIGVASDILEMYYRTCIESVLAVSFTCWYGSLGVRGKKVLNDVVNVCSKVVGNRQACMQNLCERRLNQKARQIAGDRLFNCLLLNHFQHSFSVVVQCSSWPA